MEIHLKRVYNAHATLGVGEVRKKRIVVKRFHTLELPWYNNRNKISCIPKGNYTVRKRWSSSHYDHFIIENVPNRKYILIHVGNYLKDTSGCILVGNEIIRLKSDNSPMLIKSRATLKDIYKLMPKEFELFIE